MVDTTLDDPAPALGQESRNGLVQIGRMRSGGEIGDPPFRVDEVGRIGETAIDLVDRSFEIVHENSPGDPLLFLVAAGISGFLVKGLVGQHLGTGVRLPDHDIQKPHAFAPLGVELFQWLDRAGGNGSGERAEVEQHRRAPQLAQPQRATTDQG